MAGTPTPRFNIRTLASTDPINAGATQITGALNDIDTAMTGYSQGTFAARPIAGTAGRLYRATDIANGSANGTLYWDNGTAWVELATAPGAWTALTLGTNITGSLYTPSVRLEAGGVVRLKGGLVNGTGSTISVYTLATIPSATMRPAQGLVAPSVQTTIPASAISIGTNGVLANLTNLTAGQSIYLDGITFTTS